MEKHSVLLVGARKRILTRLATELEHEGFAVSTTNRIKKVTEEFGADKFDLVAFGRGVRDAEKEEIKAHFSANFKESLFIDGLAPIIPLLVYQVKSAFCKPTEKKKLKELKLERDDEVKLHFELDEKSHLRVVQYSLDFWYRSHQHYFLNTELNPGKYSITIEKRKGKVFLVVDVNGEEIYIN